MQSDFREFPYPFELSSFLASNKHGVNFKYGRLALPISVENWISQALSYPGVQLLELTPQIAIDATQLPQPFHRDPADQIIVATARVDRYRNWPTMRSI